MIIDFVVQRRDPLDFRSDAVRERRDLDVRQYAQHFLFQGDLSGGQTSQILDETAFNTKSGGTGSFKRGKGSKGKYVSFFLLSLFPELRQQGDKAAPDAKPRARAPAEHAEGQIPAREVNDDERYCSKQRPDPDSAKQAQRPAGVSSASDL